MCAQWAPVQETVLPRACGTFSAQVQSERRRLASSRSSTAVQSEVHAVRTPSPVQTSGRLGSEAVQYVPRPQVASPAPGASGMLREALEQVPGSILQPESCAMESVGPQRAARFESERGLRHLASIMFADLPLVRALPAGWSIYVRLSPLSARCSHIAKHERLPKHPEVRLIKRVCPRLFCPAQLAPGH